MAAPKTTNLLLPLGVLGDLEFKRSYKAAMELLDTAVDAAQSDIDALEAKYLTGSKTHDFASVADGARATTTVTVTGAALGDHVVSVSVGVDAIGANLFGYVSAANTVTVYLQNNTGGAVDLASTTLRVAVRKA